MRHFKLAVPILLEISTFIIRIFLGWDGPISGHLQDLDGEERDEEKRRGPQEPFDQNFSDDDAEVGIRCPKRETSRQFYAPSLHFKWKHQQSEMLNFLNGPFPASFLFIFVFSTNS